MRKTVHGSRGRMEFLRSRTPLRHGVGEAVVGGWLPDGEAVPDGEPTGIWPRPGLGVALVGGSMLGGRVDVVCDRVVGRGVSSGLAVEGTDAGTGRTSR
jgi:hypothetical protein